MSTEYEAFLGIGARLNSGLEVQEFLKKHACFDNEKIEHMMEGCSYEGLAVECFDCFRAEDWFVGFEIAVANDTMCSGLIGDVVNAHAKWLEIFGDVPARVVHSVKTY